MLKITKKATPPRQDVQLLNVVPPRYAEIFETAPPKHLGIALLLLTPTISNPEYVYWIANRMGSVYQTFQALLDYDKFYAEFMPAGIRKVTLQSLGYEIPHDLLGVGPIKLSTAGSNGVPTVVFYDADRGLEPMQFRGPAMAMRAMERMAEASSSYEPATHQSFSMTADEAADYRRSVGDLYENGIAVWCRELIPQYHLWRQGILAILNNEPLITALYAASAVIPVPIDLRYKAPTPPRLTKKFM